MTSSGNSTNHRASALRLRVCIRGPWRLLAAGLALAPLLAVAVLRPEEQKLHDAARGTVPHAVVRREARAILEQDPTSFVAAYVLGLLETGEGRVPEGLRELKHARELVALRSSTTPAEQAELELWHARIVLELADALDQADRLPEALQTWAQAEQLHGTNTSMPDRSLRRIDALLKLGRIDEAQQLADSRMKAPGLSDQERWALRVASARMLFAREPGGQQAYEAFEKLARDANGKPLLILPFGDLAFHARRQGHTDRALAYLDQSAGIINANSASHPFRTKAEIYLAGANWEAARSNIRNAWNVLQTKKADIRHELLADTRLTVASFYLAAGYPDRAERLALPYVSLPVRSGFSSRPIEQWEAGVNLLCWSASRQIRALEGASAAQRPWRERLSLLTHHAIRRCNEAILARRIRALVLAQTQRERPIRDAFAFVDAPTWLWGDLATVLGPGPFRALFSDYPLQGAPQRFFARAMALEAAFVDRDWDTVAELGPTALMEVPADEVLLRGRLCQRLAEAEERRGNAKESMAWFQRAYESAHSVALWTDSRLPVVQRPAEFAGSPLLTENPDGPRLSVETIGNQWTCYIRWPSGVEIRRPPITAEQGTHAAQRSHRLHRQLFSPVGLLHESDFATLEGNAVSGPKEKEDSMDRRLRGETR